VKTKNIIYFVKKTKIDHSSYRKCSFSYNIDLFKKICYYYFLETVVSKIMSGDSIIKINGNFKNKDILSLDQFSTTDLDLLFNHIPTMKALGANAKPSELLRGNIVTLLFYEPSSRTFGSFGAAVKQLGGQTIDIINPQQFSSVAKGENLEDTIRTFEAYSDAIVIRHPIVGTAIRAANVAKHVPVINAGDGNGQHPTQGLLDLATVYEKFGRLDNLVGVAVGDILNGRTIHSFMHGLSLYKNNTIYLLSPKELQLTRKDFNNFKKQGLKIIEITSEKDMPKNADFWYWTRVQKERFADLKAYEKVKDSFYLTKELISQFAGKNTIFMDPLPRVGKIDMRVDEDPRAVYLRSQIRNGMYVRMALIALVLGKLK
jgi:aspartate carbamoyltransferase catalytic subunit